MFCNKQFIENARTTNTCIFCIFAALFHQESLEMRKILTCFLVAACFLGLPDTTRLSAQDEFSNYITLSDGQFWDGNTPFTPLCINYLVDYFPIANTQKFFLSPHGNYSNNWGYPDNNPSQGRFCFGEKRGWNYHHERDSAIVKLEQDLRCIDSLGFNVIRLRPVITWKDDILQIPTGSYATYFALQDALIAQCARHNLRVVLVLGADANCFKQFDQYCAYLDKVTRHYSKNKAVMAYVAMAEPFYIWPQTTTNDKLMISNWSRKWYYLMKKNAPNQLVTLGIQHPVTTINWDPSALTYDFLSMHFYCEDSTENLSKEAIHSYFKWMNSNMDDVWIMGETGYSGTDDFPEHRDEKTGSEKQQYNYLDYIMQKSLDCGCKGFSWWQYQDVRWSPDHPYIQDHFGLRPYSPSQKLKPIASLFPNFFTRSSNENQCTKPARYYNIPGYPYSNIGGVVKDADGNPIADAAVIAWNKDWTQMYETFTNEKGEYTLHTPRRTKIRKIWLSYKGYTSAYVNPKRAKSYTSTLTLINHDGWMKNWTNNEYPDQNPYPVIQEDNLIVVGNFLGDDAQELLLVDTSAHQATMFGFQITHWKKLWSGSISDWTIRKDDKFVVGDFDGNGYDELLCYQAAQVSIYEFEENKNSWRNIWTNNGSGLVGTWKMTTGDILLPGHFNDLSYCSLLCIRKENAPQALCQRFVSNSWKKLWSSSSKIGDWTVSSVDKYYVGDFNGDDKDELLCTQVTSGNADMMSLLRYGSSWSTLWSNNGKSEDIGIYPYRDNLHVGNFDQDKADEILGTFHWATKFDLDATNNWVWSWSTYDSQKLSDWTVNPHHKVFFLKTMVEVPDYLFVVRNNSDYFLDGYSYNP